MSSRLYILLRAHEPILVSSLKQAIVLLQSEARQKFGLNIDLTLSSTQYTVLFQFWFNSTFNDLKFNTLCCAKCRWRQYVAAKEKAVEKQGVLLINTKLEKTLTYLHVTAPWQRAGELTRVVGIRKVWKIHTTERITLLFHVSLDERYKNLLSNRGKEILNGCCPCLQPTRWVYDKSACGKQVSWNIGYGSVVLMMTCKASVHCGISRFEVKDREWKKPG